jgi:hypothetical protein
MGILTRQQGVKYVISSDQVSGDVVTKRAPRLRANIYEVWTGTAWSANLGDAMNFDTLDDADEYVRLNYARVSVRPSA